MATDMATRQDKGKALYEAGAVTVLEEELGIGGCGLAGYSAWEVKRGVYEVEASAGGSYRVGYDMAQRPHSRCACGDRPPRGQKCKHAAAVEYAIADRDWDLKADVVAAAKEAGAGFDI